MVCSPCGESLYLLCPMVSRLLETHAQIPGSCRNKSRGRSSRMRTGGRNAAALRDLSPCTCGDLCPKTCCAVQREGTSHSGRERATTEGTSGGWEPSMSPAGSHQGCCAVPSCWLRVALLFISREFRQSIATARLVGRLIRHLQPGLRGAGSLQPCQQVPRHGSEY